MRVMLPVAVGVLAVLLAAAVIVRARRRKSAVPELNQHPERLEQMLDETDDA
jgi:hypothetical protein